jgi:hypothetical protein
VEMASRRLKPVEAWRRSSRRCKWTYIRFGRSLLTNKALCATEEVAATASPWGAERHDL